jgi:tetratricopeptide (TPR) repeat protein
VTTREVLGISGEHVVPLSPLGTGHAAELFEHRASAARRNFAPTGPERAAVTPLVDLLDGLPLAIELAAARVRIMPPRMLLDRMSERFKLLVTGGRRDGRQSTLRATIDWSWGLLSRSDQVALAQLSVFEGGFTLTAAEAVLDLSIDGQEAGWAIDAVQSLVEKSMLRQVGESRLDMLRSVQEFAAEQLLALKAASTGVEAVACRQTEVRHWRYFAQLGARTAPEDFLDADNRVIACRRAAAAADMTAASGALASAWAVLRLTGPFRVAVELAARVRGMSALGELERANVEFVAGSAHQMLGDVVAATACFEQALGHARSAGDRRSEARVLCGFGELLMTFGNMDMAEAHLLLADGVAHELSDGALRCWSLNALGTLAKSAGKTDEAHRHYSQALQIALAVGDVRWEGGLRGNLGTLAHDAGRRDEAREHYERALVLARQVHDRQWEGNTRCNLALLHHEQGHAAEAALQFQLALGMARELGHARLETVVLCNLGIVEESRGALVVATAHYESAVRVASQLRDRRAQGQACGYLGLCCAKAGRFDRAAEQFALAEDLLANSRDSSSLALLACQRAHTEYLAGEPAAARAALKRAQSLAGAAATSPDSELARALDQVRRLLAGPPGEQR